jgi:hypothetical protein
MRYVMVTPHITLNCLRDSTRNLRFNGVMDRFGMVFLHDLDIWSCKLGEIDQQDPAELTHLGGRVIQLPGSIQKKRTRPLQLGDGQDQEDFPWGQAPSWQRVLDLLATECCTFLRPWEFIHGKQDDGAFHNIFKVFTREIWLSVGSHFIESTRLPNPTSLEEAMRTWTPQWIEQRLGKDRCHFVPSTHGLIGKYPKNSHSKSFADMRTIFFPGLDVNIRQNSIWNVYTQNGAYIELYRSLLERWSGEDVRKLNGYLDDIFSNLQCLPTSKSPDASGTTIWSAVGGKVQFVTNSSFYRISEVGGKAHDEGVPARPQTSSRQLHTRIHSAHGGVAVTQSRTRARTKSLKTRNRRNPPLNKKRTQCKDYGWVTRLFFLTQDKC